MKPSTFAQCMDIFDWFDDPAYEFLNHICLAKLDADERIARALPHIIKEAASLLAAHADRADAYPIDALEQIA